jgi:hypothetical protein
MTLGRLVLLVVALAPGSAQAQDSRETGPADAVVAYYAGAPLPSREQIDRLASPEANVRAKAAQYLRDLLSLLDEL